MEHQREYSRGHYHAVEEIRKVSRGYAVRVTAYDTEPPPPAPIKFDVRVTVPTLEAAYERVADAVAVMRQWVVHEPA